MPVRRKTSHIRANDGNDGLCAGIPYTSHILDGMGSLICCIGTFKLGKKWYFGVGCFDGGADTVYWLIETDIGDVGI